MKIRNILVLAILHISLAGFADCTELYKPILSYAHTDEVVNTSCANINLDKDYNEIKCPENEDSANIDYSACRQRDSLLLVDIYNSIPPPATEEAIWDFENPLTSWTGVVLNAEGCVEKLGLYNRSIGQFPMQILDLTSLTWLDLSYNSLGNQIPDELYDLTSLTYLSLYGNGIGEISPRIGNLTQLEHLNYGRNSITVIPNEIGQLLNLNKLWLGINGITSLPIFLKEMQSLTDIRLAVNSISEDVKFFEGFDNLQKLILNQNNFYGCYPEIFDRFCNDASLVDFSDNPRLPWSGDFDNFCNGSEQHGSFCDDQSEASTNDRITEDCTCQGSCNDIGATCNDNNPRTTNDIHNEDCKCVGTPCPEEGTACDDGDPNTVDDQEDGLCVCAGVCIFNWGEECDDDDPSTYRDIWNSECECEGRPCKVKGTICNDRNDYTLNEVEDGFCNCEGTCHVDIGENCDDKDSRTYDDIIEDECQCRGIRCPQSGVLCDDGNPNTYDDKHNGSCKCLGKCNYDAGAPCDDDNPLTYDDNWQNCVCIGTCIHEVGSPCDDGDVSSKYDIWTSSCSCLGYGQNIFVNKNATGLDNGTSWQDAFTDLQDALLIVNEDVHTIWITGDIYTLSRNSPNFYLRNNTTIIGGFRGDESAVDERDPDYSKTTLSADKDQNDRIIINNQNKIEWRNRLDNAPFVIYGYDFNINMESIIIEGAATGVRIRPIPNQSIGIKNCIFQNNVTTDGNGLNLGAALNISGDGARVVIDNCIFRNNSSGSNTDTFGSTMSVDHVDESNPPEIIVKNSLFEKNYTEDQGSIISNLGYGTIDIVNTIFNDNFGNGSIIFQVLLNKDTPIRFYNSSIYSSDIDFSFVNIFELKLNSILQGRIDIRLYNTIIESEGDLFSLHTPIDQPIVDFEIVHSVFSQSDTIFQDVRIDSFRVNINNHFETTAKFINPFIGDFRVPENSIAVNNGSNDHVHLCSDFDYLGSERIHEGIVDIGAIELTSCLPYGTPCDDGRDITVNDMVDDQCICRGLLQEGITGYVFHDINGNGIKDEGETGLENFPIFINSAALTTFSFEDGRFSIISEVGEYIISIAEDACWISTTPNEYTIDYNGTPVNNIYFGLKAMDAELEGSVSLVSAATRCGFTVPFWLSVFNSGCTDMISRVEVVYDSLVTYVEPSLPSPTSHMGNVLRWDLENFGLLNDYSFGLNFQIAGEDFVNQNIDIRAILYYRDELGDYQVLDTYDYTSEISCAIDPNDKQIRPFTDEKSNSNYTLIDQELEYIIRFQNVGTDTAFNIVVRDTLSPNLDLSTFRIGSSSHENIPMLSESGLLEFHFRDILLVDSITNEPASHGFVNFHIKPKEGIQEFDNVKNSAGIYFDFNRPVITNTVKSTFVSEFDNDNDGSPFWLDCNDMDATIFPGAQEIIGNNIDENCDGKDLIATGVISLGDFEVNVYPVPSSQQLNITMDKSRPISIAIYDFNGREIYSDRNPVEHMQLDISAYAKGVYILEIKDVSNNRRGFTKFTKID